MSKLAQHLTLAAIVVVTGLLTAEPIVTRSFSSSTIKTKAIVAQRYPLRSRSNNFFNRSKISYTRGK